MTPEIFKYLLVAAYVVAVYWLSWRGMKRTRDIGGFTIGNKDMSPYLVGITLAASISSTATFVINPGFVYAHGVSAWLHYGVAASLGIICAFVVLTRGFLRLGEAGGALTIPSWIQLRYGSRGLSLCFALINLLSITFVVLILVGCSLLVTGLFPIDQKTALVLVLLFVFSYVLMGGAYAHAYTNALQGILMLGIALWLFLDGWHYFRGDVLASLRGVGENYARAYNPDSSLYFSFFSVFGSGFIITFALMLQPHILTKVLYLRSDRDIGRFIITTIAVGGVFALMLVLGFYARLAGVETESQDAVVREYLLYNFSDSQAGRYIMSLVFVALLAAGMSTLDGILVALSAMVANDIVAPLTKDHRHGLVWSRYILICIGILALALAWNPPPLVGLFAQKGVYGLAAALLVPILFGVLCPGRLPLWLVSSAAMLALLAHLYFNLFGGVVNPAVSASYGILLSLAYTLFTLAALRVNHTADPK